MTGAAARVGWFARQVVLRRAAIVAAVAAVVHLIIVYGLLPDTAGPLVVDRVGQTIDALAVVIALFAVRAGVTPADIRLAPTTTEGKRLIVAPPGTGGGSYNITTT